MFLAVVLYICALYALIEGGIVFGDVSNIMQQIYAAIHIIGGLSLFGIAYAIHRICAVDKSIKDWKKGLQEQQDAKAKAEALSVERK